MFSSAQIEYIQYWLHAVKLTREPIALPSTEYLIQKSDLQHVSSVVYKDGQEFKKAQKVRAKSHGKKKNWVPQLLCVVESDCFHRLSRRTTRSSKELRICSAHVV